MFLRLPQTLLRRARSDDANDLLRRALQAEPDGRGFQSHKPGQSAGGDHVERNDYDGGYVRAKFGKSEHRTLSRLPSITRQFHETERSLRAKTSSTRNQIHLLG